MTQVSLTSTELKKRGHAFIDAQAEILRINLREKQSTKKTLVEYV